jgi:hypothetical protein
MVLRIATAASLLAPFLSALLPTALTAQPPPALTPPLGQKPADPPPPAPPKSPAERLEELQRELQRLQNEIAYVQERVAKSSTLLGDKLRNRTLSTRAIDAGLGTAVNPLPAPAPVQPARLLSDDERTQYGKDVMMVVDGRPVTEEQVKSLVDYLGTVPASGDVPMREQRALLELIRVHNIAAHFRESAIMAEEAIRGAETDLANGGAFEEVMNRYGGIPEGQSDGKVKIPRFCKYGLLVEQAAFSTKPGERSKPVRGLTGWVLVHVDSITKGPTSDGDIADVRMILLPYHSDPEQVDKARTLAVTGQVGVAVRTAEDMAKLPLFLQPKAKPDQGQGPKVPMQPVELPKDDAPKPADQTPKKDG